MLKTGNRPGRVTEYETDLSMCSQSSGSRTSNANVESSQAEVESDRQFGRSGLDRQNTADVSEGKDQQHNDKNKRKAAKNKRKKKRRSKQDRRDGKLLFKSNYRG